MMVYVPLLYDSPDYGIYTTINVRSGWTIYGPALTINTTVALEVALCVTYYVTSAMYNAPCDN